MKEGKYSVKEILGIVHNNLGTIMVPVELGDEITRPILEAREMIMKCIEALKEPEPEAKPAEEQDKEPADGGGE